MTLSNWFFFTHGRMSLILRKKFLRRVVLVTLRREGVNGAPDRGLQILPALLRRKLLCGAGLCRAIVVRAGRRLRSCGLVLEVILDLAALGEVLGLLVVTADGNLHPVARRREPEVLAVRHVIVSLVESIRGGMGIRRPATRTLERGLRETPSRR
jgi:hypothetical protein